MCARRVAHGAAIVGFPLLAIAHTWPLAARLSAHLPGAHVGDNAAFAWNVWWMREALNRADATFFYTDALFAPIGVNLVRHTHTALGAAVAAMLPVDVIPATNLMVVACVALNGLAAYFLAVHLTGSPRAAGLAGVLFLGAPPLTVRLLGHFNLLYAWTLVAAVGSFMKASDTRSVAWSLASGAALGLVAWADYYLFVYASVAIASTAVVRWAPVSLSRERRKPTSIQTAAGVFFVAAMLLGVAALFTGRTSTNIFTIAWALGILWLLLTWRVTVAVELEADGVTIRNLAAATVVLVATIAPLAWWAVRLWLDGDYVAPTQFWRSGPPGFDVATLVLGPPWHSIAGSATRGAYDALRIDALEMSGWLGITAPVLTILTLRNRSCARERRTWIVLAVVFLMWGAGPFLHAGGIDTGILLPQQALRYVPVLADARMPSRALIVVSLAFAMLASLWARGRSPALVLALSAAAFAEQIAAPLPTVGVPTRDVDRALAARAPGVVIEIPFGYRDGSAGVRGRFDSTALLGQIAHRHPMAGGFIARIPARVEKRYAEDRTLRALIEAAGRGQSTTSACRAVLDALQATGARYAVVTIDDRQVLYELGQPCPPPP